MASKHLISKQNLQLRYYDRVAAGVLQKQLSDWLIHSLNPALAKLFEEIDNPGYRLRFDSLVIDAGEIKGTNWREQLTEKVCRELKMQIRSSPQVFKSSFEDQHVPARFVSKTTIYSEAEEYQLVWYYLKTGQLPWYVQGLETTLLLSWLYRALSNGFFNEDENIELLKRNPKALERLLLQAKPATIENWFMGWQAGITRDLLPVYLETAIDIFGRSSKATRYAYALLFERLAGQQLNTLSESMLQEHHRTAKKNQHEKFDDAEHEVSKDLAYFIHNAGLILLHPFLHAFFQHIGLRNDKEWISDDAHKKGVLLLHYLHSFSTMMMEYELPLCKLLCGWPMHQPLESYLELTGEEIQEANNLLEDVITQWSILKTTSIETLQSNFLQRNGKLSHTESGWLLQVEHQSIDILVEHLPWTIGVVKNTMMAEILFTEWV